MAKIIHPELCIWCGDDDRLAAIHPKGVSYGFKPHCHLRGSNFRQEGWSIHFDIAFQSQVYHDIIVPLIGRHNALNAMAVFGIALKLGIRSEQIKNAFKSFPGVGRRCEKKGEKQGILVIDDYGHHPAEINATLKAIRQATVGRRLVAVFQPHRYTRTRDCLGTFGNAFDAADHLVITDIYGAGEKYIEGISSKLIFDEVVKSSPISCEYHPYDDLDLYLQKTLKPSDVVVTLGAGDITKIGPLLLKRLENVPQQR